VQVTLKTCTLYKGIPYGLAQIHYNDPDDNDWLSFEGLGIFTDGKLQMGPFSCIARDGRARSSSLMMNGRPAENHFYT
jgi:hypothetical protein